VGQTFRFNFELNLNAGMPVQDVKCRTHEFITDYPSANQVAMKLDPTQKSTANRDIIINYSLRGSEIQSGLLLYENGEEQHFLMMIQPPKRIKEDEIPPREYLFVLDISGSMDGFPLEISKALMRNLIVNLKPTDQFNLVLFAGGSALFSPLSVDATAENIEKALKIIDSSHGWGGTELLKALETAYAIPKPEKAFSRSVVLLSDGYIDAEKKCLDLVNRNLGKANFFSFGIGTSVNRYLMEGLAFMGKGEAIIVENKKQAASASEKFRSYIQTPLLSNIRLDFGDWQVYDVEPAGIPDLMAERPLVIHGKYRSLACGKVKVMGNAGKADFLQVIDVTPVRPDESNRALPLLWAKERIQKLEYFDSGDFRSWGVRENNGEEILRLGLQYSLMTSKTSFIAIDERIINNKTGKKVSVKQPLPLPHNVSELAVGEVIEILNVVEDDLSVESEYDKSVVITQSIGAALVAEDSDVPFVVVEQMPSFPGGQAALSNFLTANIKYPAKARAENVQGRVIVQFTVDRNGDIKDVEVVRSISPELDAEAIRVVMSMPRWIPGKQRGKTVAVKYTLPVNFKLSIIEKSLTTS
jgi:Ca-activated chloride channel family protein